jgi:hypothetical protein
MDIEKLKVSDLGQLEPGSEESKKIGRGETYMCLRMDAGEYSNKETGEGYDLSVTMNGAMMITSRQSDRTFIFDWHSLVALALVRGLDNTNIPVDPIEEE